MNIYVYGFNPEDFVNWPEDISRIAVELPLWPEFPLLVHRRVAEEFQKAAVDLPDAVLYLPMSMEETQDSWLYFDEVVHEGDWDALRRSFACAFRLQARPLADEVRDETLANLAKKQVYPSLVEMREIAEHDLPFSKRFHLKSCSSCMSEFSQALIERITLYRVTHASRLDA